MNKYRVFQFLLLSLLLQSCDDKEVISDPVEIEAALQSILTTNRKQSTGIVAVVLYPDGTSWQGEVGSSDPSQDIGFSPTTSFCMASVAKTFIAAQILLLESQGELELTDPLSKFLDPNSKHSYRCFYKSTTKSYFRHL